MITEQIKLNLEQVKEFAVDLNTFYIRLDMLGNYDIRMYNIDGEYINPRFVQSIDIHIEAGKNPLPEITMKLTAMPQIPDIKL